MGCQCLRAKIVVQKEKLQESCRVSTLKLSVCESLLTELILVPLIRAVHDLSATFGIVTSHMGIIRGGDTELSILRIRVAPGSLFGSNRCMADISLGRLEQ